MSTDRYPVARNVIVTGFGSVREFCRRFALPHSTVVRVLRGSYGAADDTRQRARIAAALAEAGVAAGEIAGLWARMEIQAPEYVMLGGKRHRITITIEQED
jgi:hypothetical protein